MINLPVTRSSMTAPQPFSGVAFLCAMTCRDRSDLVLLIVTLQRFGESKQEHSDFPVHKSIVIHLMYDKVPCGPEAVST